MKKILLLIFVFAACTIVFADENYVSPENYAVNDDDIRAIYQELMTPLSNSSQQKSEIKYSPDKDDEKGIRATLRRIRYNHMNPYHGEKHQIKVNSQTKK